MSVRSIPSSLNICDGMKAVETTDNGWLEEVIKEAIGDDKNVMNSKCRNIARSIQDQRTDLLNLVKKLEPIVTEKHSDVRERGTHILSGVVQNLPKNFLHQSELHYLTLFFCDRLKDYNIVIPAILQGILALVQMHHLPRDAPAHIVTTVFEQVQCQTLKQDDRRTVYKILEVLTLSYKEELRVLGPELVAGVIATIDGERDPRNLMQLFAMLPSFLTAFTLGHLAEEMFDVMACYFPVDFYSVPSHPNAVTRDELATALKLCLVAVPEFVDFCMPLLLEKLDSQLRIAKIDSLQLLQEGCRTFAVNGMEKYLYDLCKSLQREVVSSIDKEVCKEALSALEALMRMIFSSPLHKDTAHVFHTCLDNVISGACLQLQNVELSTFQSSVQMLLAISHASSASCEAVAKAVVPMLLKQSQMGLDEENMTTLLQTLTSFLSICEKQQVIPADVGEAHSLYLEMAQGAVPASQLEGMRGLSVSVTSLTRDARLQAYELACAYVLQGGRDRVRQEAIACLKRLALHYPNEVMEFVVSSRLQCREGEQDVVRMDRCVDALCCIAVIEPFTACIVPQLLGFVTDHQETDVCHMGVRCLRKLVLLPDASASVHGYLHMQCGAVSRLVRWWLSGNHDDEQLLLDSATVVSTIVRMLDHRSQSEVLQELLPLFGEGDTLSHHTQSVVLLEALLGVVYRDVVIPALPQLLSQLQMLVIQSSHPLTVKSSARLLACLVNKARDDDDLLTLLSGFLAMIETILDNPSASLIEVTNATTLILWITKALVLRGHKSVESWADKLVILLEHPLVGAVAAEGFRLVMDHDEYLSSGNHCIIRILYRQRFFQVIEKLVKHYDETEDCVRTNFLIALTYLLQGVPNVVLGLGLSEYVPLLKEALEQTEVVLLLSAMQTLSDLLESKQSALEDHIHTFLLHFLRLTKFKDSMKVRIAALQCVAHICNYPTHLLLPLKHQTVQQLTSCLDDHKRLVRQQAVATCSCWHLVGAPVKS
ncbi:MMS19 nucleotide excision repair protein homolog isoform X1 [Periplaneta americana]|uniref:MMS19 nucleotide excision repair protein homolog isoform X1 n=1 Tax=Periplaneta americana TaxID=6978 RepID=UPI0037E997FD